MSKKLIASAIESSTFHIHIGGSLQKIKEICNSAAMDEGMCVTVLPQTFIYSGGEEEGAKISFRAYPRFPTHKDELQTAAISLAKRLVRETNQSSAMVEGLETTNWIREEGRDT